VIYHYFPSEASEGSHYQLFDLANDPFESTNVATSNPKQLRVMMQRLAEGLKNQKALYPLDSDGKTPLEPQVP
jgi:hypothetical protein